MLPVTMHAYQPIFFKKKRKLKSKAQAVTRNRRIYDGDCGPTNSNTYTLGGSLVALSAAGSCIHRLTYGHLLLRAWRALARPRTPRVAPPTWRCGVHSPGASRYVAHYHLDRVAHLNPINFFLFVYACRRRCPRAPPVAVLGEHDRGRRGPRPTSSCCTACLG
jgi:hypothetical protein